MQHLSTSTKKRRSPSNAKRDTDVTYLPLDGELINGQYSLLMALSDHLSYILYQKNSPLRSLEIFTFLENIASKYPKPLFVGFGLNFDFQNILVDLPLDNWIEIRDAGETVWNDYIIKLIPHKFLEIVTPNKVKILIDDIRSFFTGGLIQAANEFDIPVPDIIVEYKQRRGTFETDDIQNIMDYTRAELQITLQLVNKLKTLAANTGFHLRRCYSPSVITEQILRKLNMHHHKLILDDDETLKEFVLGSYFGGRFDTTQVGTYTGAVYCYDINSAYPNAMTKLPYLKLYHGRLEYKIYDGYIPSKYAIYKIRFDVGECLYPPFPVRDKHNCIHYPYSGSGYYHSSLVHAALEVFGEKRIVIEKTLIPSVQSKPNPLAEFIPKLYELRQQYKAENKPEQYILKIALNSLYGKLCQGVGKPAFNNYYYAGFITQYTQAQILLAVSQKPYAVISIATDGIKSTEPLDLPLSKKLGEWSLKIGNGTHKFIDSGTYKIQLENDSYLIAHRALPSTINFEEILSCIASRTTFSVTRKILVSQVLALTTDVFRDKGGLIIDHTWTVSKICPNKLILDKHLLTETLCRTVPLFEHLDYSTPYPSKLYKGFTHLDVELTRCLDE